MGSSDLEDADEEDRTAVEEELKGIRRFVGTLRVEDLKDGSWFEKLLTHALATYTQKVDAKYFRQKYPDLPADAVVQERIEMAAKYAGIEGGLTSAAYTAAVAATIGSGGGASPLTLPAGGAAFVVDLAYLSQAQVKLAYDISVLYRVPLDLEDPDDLWKLIRVAFSIKAAEGAGLASLKGMPAVIRPLVKKYYSRGVLAAAKTLPVVGKYLLQRNVIKFAIPAVSVPATVAVNSWTTKTTGQQAQRLMRTEARLIEAASRIAEENPDMVPLLWAMWLVMSADGATTEDQRTLLHHVTRHAREKGVSEEDLTDFRTVTEVDEAQTWARLGSAKDLVPIYAGAVIAGSVKGKTTENELGVLERIAKLGGIEFDQESVKDSARDWARKTQSGRKKRRRPAQKTGRTP